MKTWVSWFEIPVTDMGRAVKFYEGVYSVKMTPMEMGGQLMAFFPKESPSEGVSGALVKSAESVPSTEGALLYLNGGADLNSYLSKITTCGGKVLLSKTLINEEIGYFALFIDTEGNKIALYSPN